MNENIIKRGLKYLFNLGGYQIINKKQFGKDILIDLGIIFKHNSNLTLFDVGANLGQTSLEYSKTFPKSTIFSFEPDPETYNKLIQATSHSSTIKPFNIGFGHQNEKILMNINKNSGGNSILKVSEKINEFATGDWTERIGQKEVEITTLNKFCVANNVNRIDILKIDTQGYEIKILQGGDKIITPNFTKAIYIEVLFVELYKEQAYFSEIYTLLTERGYKLVGIYNKFHKQKPPHFLLWCDALFVSEDL